MAWQLVVMMTTNVLETDRAEIAAGNELLAGIWPPFEFGSGKVYSRLYGEIALRADAAVFLSSCGYVLTTTFESAATGVAGETGVTRTARELVLAAAADPSYAGAIWRATRPPGAPVTTMSTETIVPVINGPIETVPLPRDLS